ncbi:MAG: magnesium/cobalt transporter CorA [Pseudomonadota bacterium]
MTVISPGVVESPASGVINCAVYRQGSKLRDIGVSEISEVLQQPDTFVWVGLLEPSVELMRQMQQEFGLHELAVEDAQIAHQRPKLEEYGDTLFLVLQTAEMHRTKIHLGETHIFLGPRFVVTVRHGSSSGYMKVRERCEHMPERLSYGPGYVLYSIMDFVVDHYQPIMDVMELRFDELEQELFKPEIDKDNLRSFYKLKHELLKLQGAALPLLEICNQLLRFHSEIIPRETRIYYRDILDHVTRVTSTIDRLREMINAAMQVDLAQITIRQNEVVKRLAGWGAILAIPTMVFSLYGMNFKNMPELDWKWGYPLVLGGIGIGCVLLFRRLKRAGWL